MINSDKRGEWRISPSKNLLQEWKGVEICQDYKDFQCFIYIRSYDNSLDYTNLFKWGFIINITMKMRLKIKNRSHRYDINTPRRRQGHEYTKYKMFVSILMDTCIKQHQSNIWSSVHEKAKQQWGSVEKNALLIKKAGNQKACI